MDTANVPKSLPRLKKRIEKCVNKTHMDPSALGALSYSLIFVVKISQEWGNDNLKPDPLLVFIIHTNLTVRF